MSPKHIHRNRDHWNQTSEAYQRQHGGQLSTTDPCWGVWAIPESELNVLGDVAGLDVLELGCGGAQWSICLARQGARVTGLDLSSHQIEHARDLVRDAGVDVTLVEGDAEALTLAEGTGFAEGSFDLVFNDHGATSFADPRVVVPQVARVLRPGGRFVFNISTPVLEITWDPVTDKVGDRLAADYFGMHSYDDGQTVSFQITYGAWIRLFRSCGLIVEDLVEIQPPPGATTTYDYVPLDWARRWPAEHIWVVRKPAF